MNKIIRSTAYVICSRMLFSRASLYGLVHSIYFPNGGGSIFTLVIHPATTTHSQLTDEELQDVGISRSTIRLSIGTEHIDDIIADLDQAFANV